MKHKLKITQVYKVWREIVIEVETPGDMSEAIDEQYGKDAPEYADPRWTETRELMNEEVEAA